MQSWRDEETWRAPAVSAEVHHRTSRADDT
jgi:hypothetical protein